MINEKDKQAILNGEYGITRNGFKIKYIFTSEVNIKNRRHLFLVYREVNGKVSEHFDIWLTEDFKFILADREHDLDIVGLGEDKPEPVSNTVVVTLPRALKEPQDEMWYVTPAGPSRSTYGEEIPSDVFEGTPYFRSRDDANAWFQAMKDSRP